MRMKLPVSRLTWRSPKQLGEIFFDKLGMPVIKKTATGARSTNEEVLEKLAGAYPLPKKLLEHRSLSKLKGTYTDKLAQLANPRTGRGFANLSVARYPFSLDALLQLGPCARLRGGRPTLGDAKLNG